jgi:hypothetical protein
MGVVAGVNVVRANLERLDSQTALAQRSDETDADGGLADAARDAGEE